MRYSYQTMPSWAIWPTGGCYWWRLIRNCLLWQFELSGLTSPCLGFPGGSDGKESVCSAGDLRSIPGSGRSPGEGNGNTLQYSCLENPMESGAWCAAVHGVSKSQTRLEWLTQTHTHNPFAFLHLRGSTILLEAQTFEIHIYLLTHSEEKKQQQQKTLSYSILDAFLSRQYVWKTQKKKKKSFQVTLIWFPF